MKIKRVSVEFALWESGAVCVHIPEENFEEICQALRVGNYIVNDCGVISSEFYHKSKTAQLNEFGDV